MAILAMWSCLELELERGRLPSEIGRRFLQGRGFRQLPFPLLGLESGASPLPVL
jgi:hypothetical protein